MQKSLIIPVAILYYLLCVVPTFIFAQTTRTLTPVSFYVHVAPGVCKDGVVTASVSFAAEPKNGGYFEIIGGAIDQNGITLDQRVYFKSGTYTWKGITNEGYRENPPSVGEFIIPACETTVPLVSSVSALKKQSNIKKEMIGGATTTATVSGSSLDAKNPDVSEANQSNRSKTFETIILSLVILGFVILVIGLKERG